MTICTLQTPSISAQVDLIGGMLGHVAVKLNEKIVYPFFTAPWLGESIPEELPPLIAHLQGEWPCVPFGIKKQMADFPTHWQVKDQALDKQINNALPHGYSSNRLWTISEHSESRLVISIDYPDDCAIARLIRTISLNEEQKTIEVSLSIEVKKEIQLPIALHPTFSLSEHVEQTLINVDKFQFGRTYPVALENSSQLTPDREFTQLEKILNRDGSSTDLSKLPLQEKREELVQLYGVSGSVTVTRLDEQFKTQLTWNPEHFPSLILWVSNQGRDYAPWNNRTMALGVEPSRSFFDLNPSIGAQAGTLFSHKGVSCLQKLTPETPFITNYTFLFQPL